MPFLHVPAKSGMSSQNEQSEFEFLNIFQILQISGRSAAGRYILPGPVPDVLVREGLTLPWVPSSCKNPQAR